MGVVSDLAFDEPERHGGFHCADDGCKETLIGSNLVGVQTIQSPDEIQYCSDHCKDNHKPRLSSNSNAGAGNSWAPSISDDNPLSVGHLDESVGDNAAMRQGDPDLLQDASNVARSAPSIQ